MTAPVRYITIDDLLKRDSERDLINVTDPDGLAVDEDAVNQAIANAQAEVDAYIDGRLRLPLLASEVSPQLRHYTLLVCRYYLYADKKTDAVIVEYEQAVRWLRDVAAGRASTGVVQAAPPDATAAGGLIVAPVMQPVFGLEFERRYNVPLGPPGIGPLIGGWHF